MSRFLSPRWNALVTLWALINGAFSLGYAASFGYAASAASLVDGNDSGVVSGSDSGGLDETIQGVVDMSPLPSYPRQESGDKATPAARKRAEKGNSTGESGGDEYQNITLEEITTLAVARNPALAQVTQLALAHDGSVIQAGMRKNPSVKSFADDIGYLGGAGEYGVAISQEITPRQKLAARSAAADAARNSARWNVEIQRKKVENDAYLAGYRLLIAQKKEAVAQKLTEICQRSNEISIELYRAGEISASDALQEKVELSEAQMALSDIRVEREAASKAVSVILNVPDTFYYVTDTVAIQSLDIDADALYQETMEHSPELEKARADLAAAQASARQQYAEARVNVTLDGEVYHDVPDSGTGAGFVVSVPVRIHDRNQGNILKAEREVQAANANVERIRQALTIRFREAMAQLGAAWQRVDLYQGGVLDDVDQSVRLAQEAYQRGACSSLELLNTEQTMYSVYISYLDSVRLFLETRAVLQGFMLQGGYDVP